MRRTNTLSDGKNILKETTYGNLKKIYKMQAKSCRNIFRVYQKQDNFSTELEPREEIMFQTSFGYISINSLAILMVLIAMESPQENLLIDASYVLRQSVLAKILSKLTDNYYVTIC